jgi:hypothetical protein
MDESQARRAQGVGNEHFFANHTWDRVGRILPRSAIGTDSITVQGSAPLLTTSDSSTVALGYSAGKKSHENRL